MIDPIWLSPLDLDTIVKSARKTGHLCIADNDWTRCGASAEIAAAVAEQLPNVRLTRTGFAPVTCPPTPPLESLFYPNGQTIAAAALDLVRGKPQNWMPAERPELRDLEFKGPF